MGKVGAWDCLNTLPLKGEPRTTEAIITEPNQLPAMEQEAQQPNPQLGDFNKATENAVHGVVTKVANEGAPPIEVGLTVDGQAEAAARNTTEPTAKAQIPGPSDRPRNLAETTNMASSQERFMDTILNQCANVYGSAPPVQRLARDQHEGSSTRPEGKFGTFDHAVQSAVHSGEVASNRPDGGRVASRYAEPAILGDRASFRTVQYLPRPAPTSDVQQAARVDVRTRYNPDSARSGEHGVGRDRVASRYAEPVPTDSPVRSHGSSHHSRVTRRRNTVTPVPRRFESSSSGDQSVERTRTRTSLRQNLYQETETDLDEQGDQQSADRGSRDHSQNVGDGWDRRGDRSSDHGYAAPHYRPPRPRHEPDHERRRRDSQTRKERTPPLPKISAFEGNTGEWEPFFLQYKNWAKMGSWTGQEKLERLMACLKGSAIKFFYRKPAIIRRNYHDLVEVLTERYGQVDPPITIRKQLQSLRQEPQPFL